jgi:hypothetical protein
VTGIVYLPLAGVGYVALFGSGLASAGTAVTAAPFGASFPFVSDAIDAVRSAHEQPADGG